MLLRPLQESREIAKRLEKDMIDYYENMAQAYYLLGFGYFQLYVEAEKHKLPEADQYRNMAALYKRHYEDLKESTAILRSRLGEPQAPTAGPTFEPEAPAVPPDTPVLEPEPAPAILPDTGPAIVPIAPVEEKPTILNRLKFWKKK